MDFRITPQFGRVTPPDTSKYVTKPGATNPFTQAVQKPLLPEVKQYNSIGSMDGEVILSEDAVMRALKQFRAENRNQLPSPRSPGYYTVPSIPNTQIAWKVIAESLIKGAPMSGIDKFGSVEKFYNHKLNELNNTPTKTNRLDYFA